MITELTQQQKDLFPVYVQKYTKIGLQAGEVDWDKFEYNIRKLYRLLDYKNNFEIIKCPSPIIACFAGSIASHLLEEKGINSAVDSAVGSAVRSAVDSAVNSAVYSAVGSAVNSAVNSAVYSDVGSAVDSAVDSADSKYLNKWYKYIGGQSWIHYSAYLKYYKEVLNIDITEIGLVYADLLETSYWFYPHKKFIFVSNRPKVIHLKDGKLHHTKEKAIEFEDGWGVYSLYGKIIKDQSELRETNLKYLMK